MSKVTGAAAKWANTHPDAAIEKKRYFPINAGSSTLCTAAPSQNYESYLLETLNSVAESTSWTGNIGFGRYSGSGLTGIESAQRSVLGFQLATLVTTKNGFRNVIKRLVDGACKSVPNSSPKATQYVALDAARISALGVAGLADGA